MEENNKAKELAFKMANLFNGYMVGDILDALETSIICVIRSAKDEPLNQIAAYSQLINTLSEKMTEMVAENIIKQN